MLTHSLYLLEHMVKFSTFQKALKMEFSGLFLDPWNFLVCPGISKSISCRPAFCVSFANYCPEFRYLPGISALSLWIGPARRPVRTVLSISHLLPKNRERRGPAVLACMRVLRIRL
jgi:hypothetical protein